MVYTWNMSGEHSLLPCDITVCCDITVVFLFDAERTKNSIISPLVKSNVASLSWFTSVSDLYINLLWYECCIHILKTIKKNVYSSYICNRSKIIKIFFYLWLIPGLGQESETGYYQVTAWEVCATVKQGHLLDYFITAHRISRENRKMTDGCWSNDGRSQLLTAQRGFDIHIKKILSKSMQ